MMKVRQSDPSTINIAKRIMIKDYTSNAESIRIDGVETRKVISESRQDTITHEYGHSLFFEMKNRSPDRASQLEEEFYSRGNPLLVAKDMKTQYASRNFPIEAISEAFLLYEKGDRGRWPSLVAQTFKEEFDV